MDPEILRAVMHHVYVAMDGAVVPEISYHTERVDPEGRAHAFLLAHLTELQRAQFTLPRKRVMWNAHSMLGQGPVQHIPWQMIPERYDGFCCLQGNPWVQVWQAFEVKGPKSGRVHQIYYGTHTNVLVLRNDGSPWYWCCSYLSRGEPTSDCMLAQKFMIEADEELFYQTAFVFPAVAG